MLYGGHIFEITSLGSLSEYQINLEVYHDPPTIIVQFKDVFWEVLEIEDESGKVIESYGSQEVDFCLKYTSTFSLPISARGHISSYDKEPFNTRLYFTLQSTDWDEAIFYIVITIASGILLLSIIINNTILTFTGMILLMGLTTYLMILAYWKRKLYRIIHNASHNAK